MLGEATSKFVCLVGHVRVKLQMVDIYFNQRKVNFATSVLLEFLLEATIDRQDVFMAVHGPTAVAELAPAADGL